MILCLRVVVIQCLRVVLLISWRKIEQKSSGFCDTCRLPQGGQPEQPGTLPLLNEGQEAVIFLPSSQKYFWHPSKPVYSQKEIYCFGNIIEDSVCDSIQECQSDTEVSGQ